MSEAADIAAFVRARLDEDEAVARAATPAPWAVGGDADDAVYERDYGDAVAVGPYGVGMVRADAAHIARHDPARVLRQAAALRDIADRHQPETQEYIGAEGAVCRFTTCGVCGNGGTVEDAWPCDELRRIAAIWCGHHDYQPGWAPGQPGRGDAAR